MSRSSVEELLELALADLERLAQSQEKARGPAREYGDRTERSSSYWVWDSSARSTRNAIDVIRRRLGDKHVHWVESRTCSPPPNHWAHCYCGWRPPLDAEGDRIHGKESDRMVIAHIEEVTGKPYVPGPGPSS